MEIVFLLTGMAIGFVMAWFIAKSKWGGIPTESKDEMEQLKKLLDEKRTAHQVAVDRNESFGEQISELKTELVNEREKNAHLNAMLSAKNADYKNLEEKLAHQKDELAELQKQFTEQFNNLANKILEEKTSKFTQQNKENLDQVLKPLNEKLKDFEKKVEDTYVKNVKDRTDLQVEIKKLYELNAKISEDANNLTKALKGDVKKQGNWGEVVLERILENSGLQKDREYKTQVSFTLENGGRYQPDVVIYLPENKHVVVDAKVSLTAYEQLVSASTTEEQEKYIKQHIASIKAHIKELSDKQYYKLDGMNSPEYVLMFIPIESSFSVAVQEDAELFNYAWNNKIVVVSPSTLTATLLTIASIWRQENQTRNALEIAKKGGDLYDKFQGFVTDLIDLGNRINQTQQSYEKAMNKLHKGRGNLVNRAEELRKLGAKASKVLPQTLIDRAEEGENSGEIVE